MKTKRYLLFMLGPFIFTFSSCDEEVIFGFEGITTLYYSKIKITLTRM